MKRFKVMCIITVIGIILILCKCSHCGKAFTINETDYESIVKQIKNHEFEKELDIRIKQFNSEKEND